MEISMEKAYKIIVIGDSNVGKTSLTYRYCEGKMLNNSVATIGLEFRTKTEKVNNELVKLNIWDTAGMERHRNSMVSHYYRNAHAVVLVYDMTCRESFTSLPKWIEECQAHIEDDVLMILVGNKCDDVENIKVSSSEAFQFADKHSMPFFKTSATLDEEYSTIESIFLTLALKLVNNRVLITPMVTPLNTNPEMSSSCC